MSELSILWLFFIFLERLCIIKAEKVASVDLTLDNPYPPIQYVDEALPSLFEDWDTVLLILIMRIQLTKTSGWEAEIVNGPKFAKLCTAISAIILNLPGSLSLQSGREVSLITPLRTNSLGVLSSTSSTIPPSDEVANPQSDASTSTQIFTSPVTPIVSSAINNSIY